MSLEDPICMCGHYKSLHASLRSPCWGDPMDAEVNLCPCNGFVEDKEAGKIDA